MGAQRIWKWGRLLGIWLLAVGALGATERTAVTILSTTDLHGRIFPLDYGTNRPANVGLAKLATLIERERTRDPELILLDCGDTIQGTPLAYYHNRVNNVPPDPMILVMNHLGFDGLTIGNHEYNFGLEVLEKARSEADFPWLSANTYATATSEPAYTPYLIKEVDGVRIGVLGLTTPGIPGWENPENYSGLEFRNPVEEARKWIRHLREEESVDAIVIAMHLGVEVNLAKSSEEKHEAYPKNAGLAVARALPDVDLILMGHTHRRVPALVVNGVLLAQAGRWGDHLVRSRLYFERASEEDAWTVAAKESETLAVTDSVEADPAVLALAQPYEDETQAWLNREIGQCDERLTAEGARLRDNAILDLIHRVQLDAGGAEISMAASFNSSAVVPAGPVTVRDLAAIYVYENTLYVIELTGAEVKAALENSARYFLPFEEGKSPADLIDRSIPGYNFDTAEGVEYTLDLRRPVEDRIVDLRFRGEPLDLERTYRVAINNYRYNGGGGYSMYAGAPVVFRSSGEIRNLMIQWVEEQGIIPAQPTNNWHLEW